MPNSVPKEIRTKRSKMLRGLSHKKRRAFYESQLGSTQEVLFESENKNGFIYGFTSNYIKVKTFWNPALSNTIHPVKLTEIAEDGLVVFDFIREKISELT
jgi:threonylcarbamoyladenosine tRNA methylthiotransferase MtaB